MILGCLGLKMLRFQVIRSTGFILKGETLGRNWAQRISKLSTETPTAAISSDGRLLAVAEDTDAGFQAP